MVPVPVSRYYTGTGTTIVLVLVPVLVLVLVQHATVARRMAGIRIFECIQLQPEWQHPSMHACARAQTFVLGNVAHSCGHLTLDRLNEGAHAMILHALWVEHHCQ